MAEHVVVADRLGKSYRLGQRESYKSLRESLVQVASRFVPKGNPRERAGPPAEFWALRDLSFDVTQGEVVGVIGGNGAGKSTLLKILARITAPTMGSATLRGRVGSLLEVGTGFHPELTGRENIYLSGAILGMKKAEIARSFDEIVAFAETEEFLDTPVKRYSSGMYLRLAFAVAAHLESEVLLVDEVLAVGDAVFQKKCLGKLGRLSDGGRTVLFVSHQLNAVRSLCSRVLWLAGGRLADQGEPGGVIARYLSRDGPASDWARPFGGTAVDNEFFTPLRFTIVDSELRPVEGSLPANRQFGILIEGESTVASPSLTVGFALYHAQGDLLFWSLHTDRHPSEWPPIRKGVNCLVAWVPPHLLNEGDFTAELIVSLHNKQWLSRPGFNAPSVRFSVQGNLSESPHWMMARPGLLAPVLPFSRISKLEGHLAWEER